MTNVIEFELLKAWAAGLFDGEGSALIEHIRNETYLIVVCISTTDPRISEAIVSIWGGRYKKSRDLSKYYKNSNKTDYTVTFTRREAKRFLIDIYPYLKSKQDEAIVVLRALLALPDQGEYGIGVKRAPKGTLRLLKPYYEQLREIRARPLRLVEE